MSEHRSWTNVHHSRDSRGEFTNHTHIHFRVFLASTMVDKSSRSLLKAITYWMLSPCELFEGWNHQCGYDIEFWSPHVPLVHATVRTSLPILTMTWIMLASNVAREGEKLHTKSGIEELKCHTSLAHRIVCFLKVGLAHRVPVQLKLLKYKPYYKNLI